MRDLSKSFDQRTLGLILKNLLEIFEEGDVDYQDSFDHYVFEGIDESLNILGIRANGVDEYTFYCQLARLNPDFEIGDQINLPELGKYEIYVDVNLVEYKSETWKHEIFSYFDNREELEQQLTNDDDYSYWNGRRVDENVYDSETNEEKIYHVERVDFKNEK